MIKTELKVCKSSKSPYKYCLVGTVIHWHNVMFVFQDDDFDRLAKRDSFKAFPYCPYCGGKNVDKI